MELTDILTWVVSGGGAAVVAYFLIGKIKFFWQFEGDTKRYIAFGLSGLVAVAAWLLLSFGTETLPAGNWWVWAQKLVLVFTTSFSLSQLIQAPQLRGTMRVPKPEA